MQQNYIPPELLVEYQKQQRRQKMAEAMLSQSMQGLGPTQFTPGKYSHAVAQNPLQALGNVGATWLNSRNLDKAGQGIAGIEQKAGEMTQADLSALYSDPKANLTRMLASRNPQVQAAAAALKKMQDERAKWQAEKVGAAMEARGQFNPAIQVYTGQLAPEAANVPDQEPPVVETMPDGSTQVRGKDIKETPYVRVTPAPMKQEINLGDKVTRVGREKYLGEVSDVLKGARDNILTAQKVMQASDRLYALASDPNVSTGELARPEIFLRNLAVKMGFTDDVDGVAKTQQLLTEIAGRTLEASKDLKGAITEREWPRLEQAKAGQIEYTPEAIMAIAAVARAAAHNEIMQARSQWKSALSGDPEAERFGNLHPLPKYGSHYFPESMYKELPDGTIQYTGTLDALEKKPKREKIDPMGPVPTKTPDETERERLLQKYLKRD